MNANLETINQQIIAEIETEQRNIKLCLVEDCIKAERMLFAFYPNTHKHVIEEPGATFDYYYEMEVEQLEIEHASLCAKLSAAARALINWGGGPKE